jgi:hypothetical protein
MVDVIKKAIKNNNNDELNAWGFKKYDHYEQKTINRFAETVTILMMAEIMVNRIDCLLSGDSSEEVFHKRWEEEVPRWWLDI